MKNKILTVSTIGMILLLGGLVLAQFILPAPLPETASPECFSAQRAARHLPVIAAEPHPMGSEANRRVRDYLQARLQALGLTTEIQAVYYRGEKGFDLLPVENVLGRLPGRDSSGAILVAAHYDSVITGPGASDNGMSVAAVLEALRCLKAGPKPANDIIVLFSDGEEVSLTGAELFAAEHPWMNDVQLVINLETVKLFPSMLVETGRRNGWVIRNFLEAVPAPFAYSLSARVYRSLLYGTDFNVFADREKVGRNIAAVHFMGSYIFPRYHTPLDNIEKVDLKSLQHHGSQLTAFLRHTGDQDISAPLAPDMVYFTLWKKWYIAYDKYLTRPLAYLVLLCFLFIVLLGIGCRKWEVKGWLKSALLFLLSLGLSTGILYLLWKINSRLNRFDKILWYSPHVYNDFYFLAGTLLLSLCFFSLLYKRWGSNLDFSSLLCGPLLCCACIMLATTFFFPEASYLFTWTLIPGVVVLAILLPVSRRHQPLPHPLACLSALLISLPLLLLWLPLLVISFAGLGVRYYWAFPMQAAFFSGFLMPLFLLPGSRRWVSRVSGILGLCLFFTGNIAGRLNPEQRAGTAMVYFADIDMRTASWIQPHYRQDSWQRQFIPAENSLEYSPTQAWPFLFYHYGFGPVRREPAPYRDTIVPVIETRQDPDQPDTFHIEVQISGAYYCVTYYIKASTHLYFSGVEKVPETGDSAGIQGGIGQAGLIFRPASGIFSLSLRKKHPGDFWLNLHLMIFTGSLPEFVARDYSPIPETLMPMACGTYVFKQYRITVLGDGTVLPDR